jgi:hypothetical protein
VVCLSAVGLACLALPREEMLRLKKNRVKMQNECHVGVEDETKGKKCKSTDTKCPAKNRRNPNKNFKIEKTNANAPF